MNNDYFRDFLDKDVQKMIKEFKNDVLAEEFSNSGEGLIYFTIVNNFEEVQKHINEYGININFVVYEIDNLQQEMVFGDNEKYVSIQGAINALNMALFFGYDKIAKFLLENGADPNMDLECEYTVRTPDLNWWAGDNNGTSSLNFAFDNDNKEILKLILEKGANVENFLKDIIYENNVIFSQPEYEQTGKYPEYDEYPYLINNEKLYFLLDNIREDDEEGLKLKEILLKQINDHTNFGFNNLVSASNLRTNTKEDETRNAALNIMNDKIRAAVAKEGIVTNFGGKKRRTMKRKSLKKKRKSKRRKSLKKKQRKTNRKKSR